MHRLTMLSLAVSIAIFPLSASAEVPESLQEAARMAVVTNPEVQATWNEFLSAEKDQVAAKGGYLPRVDLSAGIGEERLRPPNGPTQDFTPGNVTLSLTQMVYDGFYTRSEVHRLGYAKLVRYYELKSSAERVALEAVRAYTDVARFQELVKLAEENLAVHKRVYDQISERARNGVARGVDLEQASGRLALAESNLVTETSNLHDVSARYLRIVGQLPPDSISAIPQEIATDAIPPQVVDALNVAYVGNPDLNAALENMRSSQSNVASRRSAYQPRVDLRARQSYDDDLDGVNGETRDTVVELVMNWNLFRGGSDKALSESAAYKFNQSKDLIEKTCRDVRQTVTIAYNDTLKLNNQMGFLDQHQLSIGKAREAYYQQFDIGQRSLLDLLDTENEYFEARRAYVNAYHDQYTAQARTLSGMGGLMSALDVARDDLPAAVDIGQDRNQNDPAAVCPVDAPSAYVVTPSSSESSVVSKSFGANALFGFDKYDISPAGAKTLDSFVTEIGGADQINSVQVIGHTDSVGSDTYNQILSVRRANSVREYLLGKGISGEKIVASGKGESMPIADNATAEGRARNRRVDVEVIIDKAY